MDDTNPFSGLSGPAQQRQRELLPNLLTAVRQRRRRRQAVRAVACLGFVALLTIWLLPSPASQPAADPFASVPKTSPGWIELHDDPTVLSRYEVSCAVRKEWFVDDDSLQQLLASGNRATGLLRVGNQVLVSPAAIDRWGSDAP